MRPARRAGASVRSARDAGRAARAARAAQPSGPASYLPRPGRRSAGGKGKRRGWPRGRRSRACARRAAGRLNPLLAALRPRPRPRPWGARTGPPGRPPARPPPSLPPSARAYLSKPRPCAGLDPAARGAHAAGARPGAGAGTGRREPGWISRFHPDSPSALPADSVLLGDHVTRAAFDPGLGAGRGRGPGPEVGGVRRGTRGGAMRPRPGSRSR